ncbi:hypothetical protein ColLi_12221 [Colletotrichum liriopes]|uniref:Uncharacterized protein n=1 Tax=Colletotrichum liriopes TaxID=708192 RepID=A0AA37LYG4_9PEZI|nr:hypothetical protein ColLi_12221 [Colletotrichum liriopes]
MPSADRATAPSSGGPRGAEAGEELQLLAHELVLPVLLQEQRVQLGLGVLSVRVRDVGLVEGGEELGGAGPGGRDEGAGRDMGGEAEAEAEAGVGGGGAGEAAGVGGDVGVLRHRVCRGVRELLVEEGGAIVQKMVDVVVGQALPEVPVDPDTFCGARRLRLVFFFLFFLFLFSFPSALALGDWRGGGGEALGTPLALEVLGGGGLCRGGVLEVCLAVPSQSSSFDRLRSRTAVFLVVGVDTGDKLAEEGAADVVGGDGGVVGGLPHGGDAGDGGVVLTGLGAELETELDGLADLHGLLGVDELAAVLGLGCHPFLLVDDAQELGEMVGRVQLPQEGRPVQDMGPHAMVLPATMDGPSHLPPPVVDVLEGLGHVRLLDGGVVEGGEEDGDQALDLVIPARAHSDVVAGAAGGTRGRGAVRHGFKRERTGNKQQ